MNKLALCTLIAGSIAALPAMADGRRGGDERYERHYDERRYASQEYGEVVDVDPIYRTVRIQEPRQECWDERVVYQDRGNDDYSVGNGAAGTIVGAIAGGVLGHQFGHGNSRRAATAVGAVIGAGVGQQVALENGRRRSQTYERVGYEERCRTISNYREEQRVDGYDVTYRYAGRTYHTTLPYDPGNRIPLNVDVRPAPY